MKVVAMVIVAVLASMALCGIAYAQTSFEMKGAGAAVINGDNPKLYQSIFRLVLSDTSTITKGVFLVRGSDMQIHAKALPQDWTFLYNKDGSFHGQGPIQTTKSQTLNMELDGTRIFATNTGSMWKVSSIIQGSDKKLVLSYLVTGHDPDPTISVSTNEKVMIPNGNSAMANTGFFIPLNLEVIRGTTVTWQNEDNIGHTIQSQDGQGNVISLFNSGILKTGDTFSYKFDKPGVYHYFCTIHPWRIGIITVT